MAQRSLGIILLALAAGISVQSSAAQDASFVGALACKPCHVKAFEVWNRSSHSLAQHLLPDERKAELRCLFCHSTDAQRNLLRYRLAGVQCEACHGPGGRHVLSAVKRGEKDERLTELPKISETTCRECHNDLRSPLIRPFNYDSALNAIRHW